VLFVIYLFIFVTQQEMYGMIYVVAEGDIFSSPEYVVDNTIQ
jgi:hypothetical protein